ncbi:hypothetical protein DSO57_1012408 [Entomophthora muscae]|uniref:Uncharacterized protein n=1 Tax=Entomophthora muscae TaxID=34485 RepID=A0ACC2US12_9FUNG|nr:hypothetical protein DSO57_1012408 [Entomophthora muscae]
MNLAMDGDAYGILIFGMYTTFAAFGITGLLGMADVTLFGSPKFQAVHKDVRNFALILELDMAFAVLYLVCFAISQADSYFKVCFTASTYNHSTCILLETYICGLILGTIFIGWLKFQMVQFIRVYASLLRHKKERKVRFCLPIPLSRDRGSS